MYVGRGRRVQPHEYGNFIGKHIYAASEEVVGEYILSMVDDRFYLFDEGKLIPLDDWRVYIHSDEENDE